MKTLASELSKLTSLVMLGEDASSFYKWKSDLVNVIRTHFPSNRLNNANESSSYIHLPRYDASGNYKIRISDHEPADRSSHSENDLSIEYDNGRVSAEEKNFVLWLNNHPLSKKKTGKDYLDLTNQEIDKLASPVGSSTGKL